MKSVRLHVNVQETDSPPERLDGLTLALRQELLAAGLDDVEQVTEGPAPAGARGIDATTVGSLLVAITSSTLAATQAINTIRGWVSRGSKDCKVNISVGGSTLTLSGAPSEQQQHLVTEFLAAVMPADE
jgi:hypothetical protein